MTRQEEIALLCRWYDHVVEMHGCWPWYLDQLDLKAQLAIAECIERLQQPRPRIDPAHQRDVDDYREEMSLGGLSYDPMQQQNQSGMS
jgi:hypothetical protein